MREKSKLLKSVGYQRYNVVKECDEVVLEKRKTRKKTAWS
jgi:hypothetical protein